MALSVTDRLLRELELRWRRHGLPVAHRLNAGLKLEEMTQLASRAGVTLPAECRCWWRWHDGINRKGARGVRDAQITASGFSALSLGEAIWATEEKRQHAVEAAGTDAHLMWEPSWLAFAVDAGGGVAAFECADPAAAMTPIHVVDWHRSTPERFRTPVSASLGEVVNWWIEAFDAGGYFRADSDELLRARPELIPAARIETSLI